MPEQTEATNATPTEPQATAPTPVATAQPPAAQPPAHEPPKPTAQATVQHPTPTPAPRPPILAQHGGSAFPNSNTGPGLTRRDYFAAHAMQSLIGTGAYQTSPDTPANVQRERAADLAKHALLIADAVIAATR